MRIVVVDDHPLIRKGISMILSLETNIEVVGEGSNVKEGIEIINNTKPDLAIINLKLRKESGLSIVSSINKDNNSCKMIILTTLMEEKEFKEAEALGVVGYILKDALPEEICYAIRVIAKGRKYYDPGIMEVLMKKENKIVIDTLTCREKDVLRELGKGLNNMEIANKLFITEHTVKKHVSQVLSKLGYSDRTQAAIYAVKSGLVKY